MNACYKTVNICNKLITPPSDEGGGFCNAKAGGRDTPHPSGTVLGADAHGLPAMLQPCPVSDGLFSFHQRKEKRKRNAARNRWFLDLLCASLLWTQHSLPRIWENSVLMQIRYGLCFSFRCRPAQKCRRKTFYILGR